ncbi:hypothetical protein OIU76_003619 [Salix suchowensis]|nr:hypothetical protein OIU76_003619 [Salix suchowensis]
MEPDNLNKEQDQNSWAVNAWTLLSKLRDQSPLIQCITNFVSMDLMANTLLSAGASPAMIHSIEEIQDFTPHVHALCINVGTLSPAWLPAMREAAQVANKAGKPWVLDPVAAGASSFRLKACLELVGLKPSVIRGNGSEIIALSKASIGATKGVDSSHESMDAMEAAKVLGSVKWGHSCCLRSRPQDVLSLPLLLHLLPSIHRMHWKQQLQHCLYFGIAGEMGMAMAKGYQSMITLEDLYKDDSEWAAWDCLSSTSYTMTILACYNCSQRNY